MLSKAIRLESARNGICECVTCGCKKPWKEMQAGHAVSGRTNGIYFDERGIHPQCFVCNVKKHGAYEEYVPWMYEHYGKDVYDDLKRLRRTAVTFTQEELKEMIEGYKVRIKEAGGTL